MHLHLINTNTEQNGTNWVNQVSEIQVQLATETGWTMNMYWQLADWQLVSQIRSLWTTSCFQNKNHQTCTSIINYCQKITPTHWSNHWLHKLAGLWCPSIDMDAFVATYLQNVIRSSVLAIQYSLGQFYQNCSSRSWHIVVTVPDQTNGTI